MFSCHCARFSAGKFLLEFAMLPTHSDDSKLPNLSQVLNQCYWLYINWDSRSILELRGTLIAMRVFSYCECCIHRALLQGLRGSCSVESYGDCYTYTGHHRTLKGVQTWWCFSIPLVWMCCVCFLRVIWKLPNPICSGMFLSLAVQIVKSKSARIMMIWSTTHIGTCPNPVTPEDTDHHFTKALRELYQAWTSTVTSVLAGPQHIFTLPETTIQKPWKIGRLP